MPDAPEALRYKRPGWLRPAGFAAVVVAALVVGAGVFAQFRDDRALADWTHDQVTPTVALAPLSGGTAKPLVLPGSVEPFSSAMIHSRVSGYLKRWNVDIGMKVRAGQVLAELDTPDLDQEVNQARADLATAEANRKLSETTAKRWADLVAKGIVATQAADEKNGDLAAKTSLYNAAKANLDRLIAQQGFKRLTAPFDGVITARSADVGQLVNVGGAADTALFTVADQRRMRIYVRLPQAQSAAIKIGQTADLVVAEYPGQTFKATVAGDARSIDPQTGALLVELQIDNADGRLKAGEYGEVTFHLASAGTTVEVPGTAILFRHGGPAVAVLSPDNRVKIRGIKVARDLGTSVQVESGLTASERVVDNPPESLADGDLVKIASKGKG